MLVLYELSPYLRMFEYSSRKPQTTLWKVYGRHTDLVHKLLKGLFTNCDI